MTHPTLILIRAGSTDFDTGVTERVRGWADPPLNARGRAEAERAGQLLFADMASVSRVVSSDLARARATAEEVVAEVGEPPLTLTKGLRPWNLGDLGGQLFKTAMPEIRRLLDSEGESAPNGESFAAFQARTLETFIPLAEEAKVNNGVTAVVTHSRVLRLIKAWVLAGGDVTGTIDMQAMVDVAEPAPPGGVLVMQWDGQNWVLGGEELLRAEPKKENSMRDPFENAVREVMGFDYGGLFQGVANVAATGVQQAQQDAAAGKARGSAAAAVQKSVAADVQWASSEAVLEMAQDPSSKAAAQTMRDLAKSDADHAAAALDGDGQARRCQAAQDALRNAASAAAKSPKDAAVQARYHSWQKVADACSTGAGGAGADAGGGALAKRGGGGESWLTARHAGVPGWGWIGLSTAALVIGVFAFRSMGKR